MNAAGAGPVLVLAAALLVTRRPNVALAVVAAQAVVLAAEASFQGLYVEAGSLVVLNAIGAVVLLFDAYPANPMKPRIGLAARLVAAAVLALLAAPVSLPLVIVLLGILATASSRDRTIQILGLLAMQNGIALAGFGLGQPERIAAIVPVVPALAWAALWASRGRAA